MVDILIAAAVLTVLHANVWAGVWAYRRLWPRPPTLNGEPIHPDIMAENPYLASQDDDGINEMLRNLYQGGG